MMQDEQPADEKLLQAYLMRRDEAAFGHLVQRHLGLVFGTAFRLLGERTSAEEVAQNVFITLARKAASIRPDGGLAGWLHRAAVLEAQLRQRTDLRRRNREDLAARLAATMPPQDPADSLLLDTLDQALLRRHGAGRARGEPIAAHRPANSAFAEREAGKAPRQQTRSVGTFSLRDLLETAG